MQPTLFIDGYNLLHAAGLARRTYGPGDLERARGRLISLLASLLGEDQATKTAVVFDAKESPGFHGSTSVRDGVTVVFPDRGVEADAVIERMIREHTAPKQLRVVSSDHRIQTAAKRRRATPVDSDAFLRAARKEAATDRGPEKPEPGLVPDAEVEYWAEEIRDAFGA